MRHRIEWEKVHGPIPDKYEIDHLCKNRACCNVDHLQCLPRSEHRAKDNAERYLKREHLVLDYIKRNPKATQKKVATLFNISQPGVSRILKRNMK